MKKEILNKQIKRMLGVAMAMVMLFGSNLSVLAATHNFTGIQEDDILEPADEIYNDSSQDLTVYDEDWTCIAIISDSDDYTVQERYKVVEKVESSSSGGKLRLEAVALPTVPGTNPVVQEEQPVAPAHIHDYNWEVVKEPTLKEEGLAQNKCICGDVNAQQPISSATAFVKAVCDAIEAAPEGATVEVETEVYACYTAKIMEKLSERTDVTFKTTFLTKDKTWKTFTIPAGMAPTDGELFYGFTYLGNLYGWGECDHVHDEVCGGEEDCTHVHDENSSVEECDHIHDEACGGEEACIHVHDENC